MSLPEEDPFATLTLDEESGRLYEEQNKSIRESRIHEAETAEERVSSIPSESEFANLKLAPFPFKCRFFCPICRHSCLMYCPFCMVPLKEYTPPHVELPIQVDILHHPKEKKAKSTAVHAVALCPNQVRMWEYPTVPDYNPEETLCLFPFKGCKKFQRS